VKISELPGYVSAFPGFSFLEVWGLSGFLHDFGFMVWFYVLVGWLKKSYFSPNSTQDTLVESIKLIQVIVAYSFCFQKTKAF
jgi:hypothetical protein